MLPSLHCWPGPPPFGAQGVLSEVEGQPGGWHFLMRVEFLGVSRDRAGVDEIDVEAETLGRLLMTLSARMPRLAELIVVDRISPHDAHAAVRGPRLHSSLAANLNGDRFISDPETPLGERDRVLILSADVGG